MQRHRALAYFMAAGGVVILGLVAVDFVYPLDIEKVRSKMIVLGLVFAVAAYVRLRDAAPHATGFMEWLGRNQREVRAGVGDYHGKRIGPGTMMVRYVWVMSPLAATFSKATEHYVLGSPEAKVAKLYCMVLTALLGWWHFYGLRATPRILKENLRDENAQPVSELLDYLTSTRTETPS